MNQNNKTDLKRFFIKLTAITFAIIVIINVTYNLIFAEKLENININAKVVSMPCQELFDKQSKEYREKIIDKESIKISIEAGSIFGWEKYVGPNGISLGMKSFGKSAPYKKIYEHFNLTSDNIVKLTRKMLGK